MTDGGIHDRAYRLTSHHAGTYGDCRVRMIEAGAGMAHGCDDDWVNLLIFRVSLPFSQMREVRADSRADRLVSQKDSPSDLVPHHVDHDQFDGIFVVATNDIDAAERIFTDSFVETMLRIQDRFASSLQHGRGAQPSLVMQVANGSLQIVVEVPALGREGASMTPADADMLARCLIFQFAAAPALVDDLQGGWVPRQPSLLCRLWMIRIPLSPSSVKKKRIRT